LTFALLEKQLSFLDASHGLSLETYEQRWQETAINVRRLMKEPPDQAKLYRQTAFVVARGGGALVAHRA
jgi:hypothetical protein